MGLVDVRCVCCREAQCFQRRESGIPEVIISGLARLGVCGTLTLRAGCRDNSIRLSLLKGENLAQAWGYL